MKTSHDNILIVALLISAVVLGALVFFNYTTEKAVAGNAPDAKSGWIMIPLQQSGSQDLICVINVATRRMLVYETEEAMNRVKMMDGFEFDRVFRRKPR